MDFLALFNAVTRAVKPMDFEEIQSLEIPFKQTNIDSLDMLMITVYMCELHGISEEIGKGFRPENVSDFSTFVSKNATKFPESIQAAVESIS